MKTACLIASGICACAHSLAGAGADVASGNMVMRALLQDDGHDHDHGGGDSWFEFGASYDLTGVNEVTVTAEKVDGDYADPTMIITLFPSDDGDDHALEEAEAEADHSAEDESACTVVDKDSIAMVPAEDTCFKLTYDGDSTSTTFTIDVSGTDYLIMFAQHGPSEFEDSGNFLTAGGAELVAMHIFEHAEEEESEEEAANVGNIGLVFGATMVTCLCTFIGLLIFTPCFLSKTAEEKCCSKLMLLRGGGAFSTGVLLAVTALLLIPEGVELSNSAMTAAWYEYSGVYPAGDSTLTITAAKVDGEYADPSITIVLFDATEGTKKILKDYEEESEHSNAATCETVTKDSADMVPAVHLQEDKCFTLVFDDSSDETTFTIDTSGGSHLVMYAEHFPEEFGDNFVSVDAAYSGSGAGVPENVVMVRVGCGIMLGYLFCAVIHMGSFYLGFRKVSGDGSKSKIASATEAAATADGEAGEGNTMITDVEKADVEPSKENYCCGLHPISWSILIGDALHNITDGIAIATAFKTCGVGQGWFVTMGAVSHELSQELSDYILLTTKGGLKPWKALTLNFLSGLTAVIAGCVTYSVETSAPAEGFLLAFSSGTYIWIAASESFPPLVEPKNCKDFILTITMFSLGWLAMGLVMISHEHCTPIDGSDPHAGHNH